MRSSDIRVSRIGLAWAVALACGLPVPGAFAEDLGRIGKTYPVIENDARSFFEAEVARKVTSRRAMQESMRKSAAGFLGNLPPISGIGRVAANSTRYMDVVHTFQKDVMDANGRLMVKAGTRVNLLQRGGPDGLLFVLDGRDPRQIQMLQRLWNANYKVDPILVAGSHTQLATRFRRAFYYDYGGNISNYFGITRVPALVGLQDGRIRIEEMKP